MKHLSLLLTFLLLVAACTPADPGLPTLAQLPTDVPTSTLTDTPVPTDTPQPTDTPTQTNTPTPSDTPQPTETNTPVPSETPRPTRTIDPTFAAIGTGTAAVAEAPVFSTFTPVPEGQTAPTVVGTPQIVADLIITEPQFQEEVNRALQDLPKVDSAIVDFVQDEGILFTVTAEGDSGALTTVEFIILLVTKDGVAQMQGALLLDENAPEPSEEFLGMMNSEFFPAMAFDVIDSILNQRLGETHNLEKIEITDEVIAVSLYVPEPSSP